MLAKSYRAQPSLSRNGASGGLRSPAAVTERLRSPVRSVLLMELAAAASIGPLLLALRDPRYVPVAHSQIRTVT